MPQTNAFLIIQKRVVFKYIYIFFENNRRFIIRQQTMNYMFGEKSRKAFLCNYQ